MNENEVTLANGQSVWLRRLSGVVVDAQKSTDLAVHQDAARIAASGAVVPGQISSTTTHRQEIWLRLADGRERSFDLVGFELPVRVGHEMSLALAGPRGSEHGNYVGASGLPKTAAELGSMPLCERTV